MSDSPQNTQTPQLIATPIRLRVVQPKEPIPLGIMAALQGPPGPPGKDGGGSGPSAIKWESTNW